jgi:response regulator RpfG family c-di-GMP phosphodiesterase
VLKTFFSSFPQGVRTPRVLRGERQTVNILLIDHETYRIQSLARGLRIAGYHVLEAGTLLDALTCISCRTNHIELILTDCSTRILFHSEVLQALQERSPDTQIVMMADQAKANHGVDPLPLPTHYIGKPFTDVDLVRQIEALRPRTKNP